jgi:hypothetical protein
MRRLRLSFLLVLSAASLAALSAAAAEVSFVRVWPAWRDNASFDRITEYFTGQENTGSQIVVRTHPDTRAGFYYLVRVANPAAALGDAKFVLHVILPSSPAMKTYSFPVALPSGQTVFQLGLTGPEWPDSKVHPVAWQLELRSADDHVLTSAKSFLWEKPAK